MDIPLQLVIEWIKSYGYMVLLPLSTIEGPTATVIAGFLAHQGYLQPMLVFLTVVTGDIIGDTLFYLFGRFGGRNFIEKYGHYFKIGKSEIEHVDEHFKKHLRKTLVLGKITHVFGFATLIAGGFFKIPFVEYITWNILPTLPKSFFFLTIGYFFGQAYDQIHLYIRYGTLSAGILIVGFILLYYAISKKIEKLATDR